MADYALPALYAVLLWWFTTGVILYLDGRPRHTHRWSMAACTLLGLAALVALARSAADASVASAYVGFTAAVLLWGWLEMSFLMGYITGPRRIASPPGSRGWAHFRLATQVVIHHELAIVAVGAVVAWLCRDAVQAVGLWTFGVLWAMRLSAKLNLFLGVPNVNAELLPPHLLYLGSYFRTRPMNLLFPLSITLSTGAAGWLAGGMNAFDAGSAPAIALTLVLALLALAILEHWFMVLPLPVNELWRWALPPGKPNRTLPVSQDKDIGSCSTPVRVAHAADSP